MGSDIIGFNVTQGFASPIKYKVYRTSEYKRRDFKIDYTLPDDGSQWKVYGTIAIAYRTWSDSGYYETPTGLSIRDVTFYPVEFTVTTPGTFTGMSIGQTVDAANNAKDSADSAKSSADQAKQNTETIINNVSHLETKIEKMLLSNIVLDLSWDNQKTATLNSGEWLNVSSNGNNYDYRYSINSGNYTDWENLSDRVYIDLGTQEGYKNISFQIGQNGQLLLTKHIGIWKL